MEKKNNSGMLVGILIGLVIALLVVVGLLATGTIGFKTSTTTDNGQISENNQTNENNDPATVNQSELEKIIVDELYIITNRNTGRTTIKSINDIESYDLETLVINKYNESDSSLTEISKNEMQNILSETCLSNMTITFDGTYKKNEYTKRNLYYGKIGAFKTVSFNNENNKYMISVKYIFVDNGDSGDRGLNGYGTMDDLKENKNPIVQLYDDNTNTRIIDDIQKYLDNNFDTLKNKLATYNYTFEKQNDKIVLTSLSVN